MSATDLLVQEIAKALAKELGASVSASAKELFTIEEAAEYLSCSVQQVRNFIKSKKLRAVMIDRRPRVRRSALKNFIDISTP